MHEPCKCKSIREMRKISHWLPSVQLQTLPTPQTPASKCDGLSVLKPSQRSKDPIEPGSGIIKVTKEPDPP